MPASGKIVARETMIPLPMAVARCSWNRSIAAMISSRLCVGACTTDAVPAKGTTPMRTFEGCSATKAFAAACAAEIRLGCTSTARILPETSMARMMVKCWDGKVITAAGRAMATIIVISATRKRNGGMCRRNLRPAPSASFTMLKLAYLSAACCLRRNRKKYPATSAGTTRRSQSISGHRNFMVPSQVLRQASARRQLAPALAQVGESQDGVDEIVFCGQLQRIRARLVEGRPELLLTPLGQSREALPESPIVGVDE